MLLSSFVKRPAALAAILAFSVAACSGASSDEPDSPTSSAGGETVNAAEGALGDMAVGSDDATITVIEYASVTCPHCATFHETIFPAIKEQYIDTGKVRFVFREFPTAPGALSVAGSMLARCAADKGGDEAYFLLIDSLFKTQRTWIYGENPRGELLKIAAQAGIDEAAFDACVKREDLLELINKNVDEGSDKYGIASTPSFIIDGRLRHFSTEEAFTEAIEAALEKAAQ